MTVSVDRLKVGKEITLSSKRMKEIEDKTLSILGELYPSITNIRVPIELGEVLNFLGVKLKKGEFEENRISGAYDRNTSTIYISSSDLFHRQKFTIAHGLGHHFLHPDKIQETFYRDDILKLDDPENTSEEQEANLFAASLLIPRHISTFLWEGSVEGMASLFGVSYSVAKWRAVNLGMCL